MPCLCTRQLSARIIRDVINFFILLHNVNAEISEGCESNNGTVLPYYVPCHWRAGVIPYTFNLFSLNPKRLISLVKKGLKYLEDRSCLVFKEYNPIRLARWKNYTHIYFSYSDVLESCCIPFFTKKYGRRMVLITPECTLPAEVAHTTIHGIGLLHGRKESFRIDQAMDLLFHNGCDNMDKKLELFNKM